MSTPIHHIHKRKRKKKKMEPYPHNHPFKRFMDKFVYVIGIAGPLIASTQVYKIYHDQTAAGVSVTTFAFNAFMNMTWMMYGFLHKEKPIIASAFLWFLIDLLVAIGVVIYG